MKSFTNHIRISQIIGIAVLTGLFRAMMPLLIAELGIDTHTGHTAAGYSLAGSWIHIAGLVLYIYAIVIFAMERYLDLPFWYGRSQSAGSNANGAIIVSIAIALFMLPPFGTAALVLVTIVIQIFISEVMGRRRDALESKYASRSGISEDEINGKGFADFDGEKVKVFSKEVIPAGKRVQAAGVRGSRIIVRPEETNLPDLSEDGEK